MLFSGLCFLFPFNQCHVSFNILNKLPSLGQSFILDLALASKQLRRCIVLLESCAVNCLTKYSSWKSNMNLTNNTTVNCHLSMSHAIALMTTNSLTAVLGTFGNILVCVTVLTSQRLRRCSNFLLVSLAVADLIITIACAPLLVVMAAKLSFAQECLTTLELVYSNIAHLSCSSSILHLAAISVDRYLAVVFPFRHGSIMKNFGLKIMLVVVWGTAILFTSLRVPFYKETSLFAFALFAVSYIIIIASYVSILTFLVKERQRKKYFRAAE